MGRVQDDPSLLDVAAVVEQARGDAESGLTASEVARRLAQWGPNELESAPPEPRWRQFAKQFEDPLIYLLFAAIVISLVAWALEGSPRSS